MKSTTTITDMQRTEGTPSSVPWSALQQQRAAMLQVSATGSSAGTESQIASTGAVPWAIESNWGKIQNIKLGKQLYQRIFRVALPTDSKPVIPAALGQFLDFWAYVQRDAVQPELTLARDGSLYAEWYKSPRQHLDVRFVADRAMFGLFNNADVLEGSESASTVASRLQGHPSKPLRWSAR